MNSVLMTVNEQIYFATKKIIHQMLVLGEKIKLSLCHSFTS